jgi:hypothetical protein
MPENRLTRALLSGILLSALTLAVIISLQIVNWIIGDPRWWIVVALIGTAGVIVQWESDSRP